jgi:tRNA-2-methylthio-N6-dimethylallyladenosine synthase
MAQRLGERLVERFGHVDLVCGTRAFLRVPGYLRRILAGAGPVVDVEEAEAVTFERMASMRVSPHRAYVSVMRGCDNFCSYCVVPHVRGRAVSRARAAVLEEVRSLAEQGVKEVILLGQNVNAYGRDLDGQDVGLAGLLERVDEVAGLERIRFITSHPRDMTEEIVAAVAELPKVCEHLHVPPQSGSDAVLERMRRGYTSADYRGMARRARRRVPDLSLAGDFIVGFPGETEADFHESLRLLRETAFQQAFIFKYSPRPGTLAARRPDDVPDQVKRERNQRMLEAQRQVDAERRAAMVGATVEVLVDGPSKTDPDRLSGRTRGNDIVVFSPRAGAEDGRGDFAPPPGTLERVKLTDSTDLTLFGQLVPEG